MKLVDEAVVIEYVEIEKVASKILLSKEAEQARTQRNAFTADLKVGIIRDLQESNFDGWKTNKLVKENDIVLFNTTLSTAPSCLPVKEGLDGKVIKTEIRYTQEIKCVLEEGDIKKYNLDIEAEYQEAKRRIRLSKKEKGEKDEIN